MLENYETLFNKYAREWHPKYQKVLPRGLNMLQYLGSEVSLETPIKEIDMNQNPEETPPEMEMGRKKDTIDSMDMCTDTISEECAPPLSMAKPETMKVEDMNINKQACLSLFLTACGKKSYDEVTSIFN
jgi:hypothetical protein